jgi:carbon storage regulator
MLNMNRRIGQTVVIGDQIEVTLIQVQLSQNQVRLGITAPQSVGVYRKELLQAIQRENRRAASAPAELPDILPSPPILHTKAVSDENG